MFLSFGRVGRALIAGHNICFLLGRRRRRRWAVRSLPPTLGGHSWCARGTYRNVLHKDTFSVFVEGTIFWVVETIVEERPRGRVYLPHKRTYMHRSLSLRGLYSVAERKKPRSKNMYFYFSSHAAVSLDWSVFLVIPAVL